MQWLMAWLQLSTLQDFWKWYSWLTSLCSSKSTYFLTIKKDANCSTPDYAQKPVCHHHRFIALTRTSGFVLLMALKSTASLASHGGLQILTWRFNAYKSLICIKVIDRSQILTSERIWLHHVQDLGSLKIAQLQTLNSMRQLTTSGSLLGNPKCIERG
jgi:hypothetical protein